MSGVKAIQAVRNEFVGPASPSFRPIPTPFRLRGDALSVLLEDGVPLAAVGNAANA
jgi:hypothetical protein